MKKNATADKLSKLAENHTAGNPVFIREAGQLLVVSSFSSGRIIMLILMIIFLLLCSWRICQTATIGIVWFVFPAMLLFFVMALWIDLDAVSSVNINLKSKELVVRKRLFLYSEQRFYVHDIQEIRREKSMVRVPYNVWYLSVLLRSGKKLRLAVGRQEGRLEKMADVLNELGYRTKT